MRQPNQLPDEKEFLDWLAQPVTQAYREMLKKWQFSLMEQWASGTFQGDLPNLSFSANAGALGEFSILGKLSELDFEKFHEVMKDE